MSVQILQGDVRLMLATLPAESVQCVVTSPPYFGLRAYGTNPQVWGGDPEHEHEHEWGSTRRRASSADTAIGIAGTPRAGNEFVTDTGRFCPCGAWRGELGSEPMPSLFIEHLVSIFDGVRRVMRKDGVLFVNLGSSYAGSGKGPTGKSGIGDQAKCQGFVGAAATSDQSLSLSPAHVPACDSDGTARSDSLATDSAYSGLCDECLAGFLSHRADTAGTLQPQRESAPPSLLIVRDSATQDSEPATPDASALSAQESTTLESWLLSRDECSRCASRAASFDRAGLLTDGRVARGSAHTTASPSVARLSSCGTQGQNGSNGYSGATVGSSVGRIHGTGADSLSLLYSAIAAHHWQAKDLMPIPEMFALAMRFRGWIVRSDICWAKTSAMPESTRDRPTSAWEHIYMFTKQARYFWDQDAVRQPLAEGSAARYAHDFKDKRSGTTKGMRVAGEAQPRGDAVPTRALEAPAGANLRNFWLLGPEPSREQHYAAFPSEIPRRCILAATSEKGQCPACGSPWVRVVERPQPPPEVRSRTSRPSDPAVNRGFDKGGVKYGSGQKVQDWLNAHPPVTTGWAPSCQCDAGDPVPQLVLDPFLGSGTTALVADRLERNAVGIELNPEYAEMARRRITNDCPMFVDVEVAG